MKAAASSTRVNSTTSTCSANCSVTQHPQPHHAPSHLLLQLHVPPPQLALHHICCSLRLRNKRIPQPEKQTYKNLANQLYHYAATSHSRMMLSPEHDAKYFPLESNATHVTLFVWPVSCATCCCAATSHNRTLLS
jgi:hypothetical protein